MKANKVEKYYYAIVEGLVECDSETINEPIGRLNAEDIIRVVDPSGKECITHYEVEERFGDKTLVKLKLETGRTHQIRVHMKHIGHPVLGDTLYGSESKEIGRQALHCYKMIFMHPITGDKIVIKSELPEDMKKVIH
jgi:23S rRNA pseudouridine1911/1915/1917 synthase